MNYEILTIKGKLYKIIRIVKEDPKWNLEILRTLWHCTHTFKKNNMVYFVQEIEDIEYEELL
tara:strand:- start:296 stop:481 length:186 start_codon:yes stop_codon:yes gene_type:complete